MTKLIPVALAAALALVAGAASADDAFPNTFSLDRAPTMGKAEVVTLTDVQAEQAGSVLVYEHDGDRLGNLGAFLGSAPIEAGATDSVTVPLSRAAEGRVTVIMMNGNHSVAKLTTRGALAN